MPDTLLVTGATGFLGRAIVPALEASGRTVWRHTRAEGDLADVVPARRGVQSVVHLAGRTFVPESWTRPQRFYRDNTLSTANVLEYCRQNSARLVYVSAYVYGTPDRLPIPETHPVRANSPYAHSKILAEEVVRYYQEHLGIEATIIRPFNVYGPGQDPRFLVPSIVRQAIDRAHSEITLEGLDSRRDYLHVDDLAGIVVAALEGTPGGTYNAGSGASTSVETLVNLVCELVPTVKPTRVAGGRRPNDIPETVADITRAAAELGWRPKVPLREGLWRTIEQMSREMTSA